MTKEELREKAIYIAMDTFLSSWEGDAVDAYNKLIDETADQIKDIDFVTAWEPFEDDSVEDVLSYITSLVNDIMENFT